MGMILTMADQMPLVHVASVQIDNVETGKGSKTGGGNTTYANEHLRSMNSTVKIREAEIINVSH